MLPLLIVIMVLGYSGNARLARSATRSCGHDPAGRRSTCCCCASGCAASSPRRFPDEPTKGTTYYAITRALQMKFMRLPKAQVKIGQELPEHYR